MKGRVVALVCCLCLAVSSAAVAKSRRTLFIVLDAVPHAAAVEAVSPTREGGALFPGFAPPVPLISSFPSTTSVALGGILSAYGLEPSPGYEARFFDWHEEKVRGGGALSYFKIRFPWREFFDWNRKGPLRNFIQSARPVRASVRELDRALKRFLVSPEEVFFIYVAATDTAAHLYGPGSLDRVFVSLDAALRRAREASPRRPFDTVIFSDHGIAGGEAPLVNVRGAVKERLEGEGFTVGERLRDPRDAVLTPFGLVSSFEAYVDPDHEMEVAETLAGVAGVDLCAVADPHGWHLFSGAGRAAFRRLGGSRWSYRPVSADPVQLLPLLEKAGLSPGRVTDDELLGVSSRASYPDPLYRVAAAFELVENPASVVCSLEAGHMFGAARTEALARLKGRLHWTHGALTREATLGFVTTDSPSWRGSDALRFDEALTPFLPRVAAAGRVRGAARP